MPASASCCAQPFPVVWAGFLPSWPGRGRCSAGCWLRCSGAACFPLEPMLLEAGLTLACLSAGRLAAGPPAAPAAGGAPCTQEADRARTFTRRALVPRRRAAGVLRCAGGAALPPAGGSAAPSTRCWPRTTGPTSACWSPPRGRILDRLGPAAGAQHARPTACWSIREQAGDLRATLERAGRR